jgi:hypothetical protein
MMVSMIPLLVNPVGWGVTFKKAPAMTACTAISRLASSQTIALFFPPNSIKQGLSCTPASCATRRPTAVLPVKFILRTAGWAIIALTTAGASAGRQETMFRQPAGRPASAKARPMAQ